MAKLIDLTGKNFGKLTVIRREGAHLGLATWLCKCECGNEKVVSGSNLRQGNTKSCGCLVKESAQNRVIDINKNGLSKNKKRTLGQRIRYLRQKATITQVELSVKINRPIEEIRAYENGDKSPSLTTAIDIATVIGLPSVSDLITDWSCF